MNYYEIAIPVRIDKLFTYKCDRNIMPGSRVLVDFNNKLISGFVWSRLSSPNINPDIRYKNIIEIIDDRSLLAEDLRTIADWMSNYYFCSRGIVLLAMLPTAIQPQIALEVKRKECADELNDSLNDIEIEILNYLSYEKWTNLKDFKKKYPNLPIYKYFEHLEELNLIEVKRLCDPKIRPKYANYISAEKSVQDIPKLTSKQDEAYKLIKGFQQDIPLSLIAETISYSIVKALKNKGLINVEARVVKEKISNNQVQCNNKKISLTDEQQEVFSTIKNSLLTGEYKPFLLHGITGSGKTEIYIRLIRECLSINKNALVLVPEIALTPQMEQWFYNAFGDIIAILHSRKNERQRWEEWKRIRRGERKIVIGARSAIFAPLDKIGIIIVDEEHETSYKQDKAPRYNARDIAVLRGKINNSIVLLGSATPSLESLQNVESGKYQLLKLDNRPLNIKRPEVIIVDMKNENESNRIISKILKEKIKERLQQKEQTLLLLNRRGYASYLLCMNCGKVSKCPKCDVSLIFHSKSDVLMCHYCGYIKEMEQKCTICGSYLLSYGTPGTQQLEKELLIQYPSAKILRMDTDTVVKKDSYLSMFERMNSGVVDILFGTQMIAKGLDFAKVTLVGVVAADNSLNVPDFRASERTFQLLTQVAGRSGRGDLPGEVIIQTYNPEHYAVKSAQEQNFTKFCKYEMPLRKNSFYPPFSRLARIVYSHKDEQYLKNEINKIVPLIKELKKSHGDQSNKTGSSQDLLLLGPIPTPIHKINNKYRYHIIIKVAKINTLLNVVNRITRLNKWKNSIKVDIDIDPLSLL